MSKVNVGDRFLLTIGGYNATYEIAEVLGGTGAPGPILYQLELVSRPRVGDTRFVTATKDQLDRKFTPVKTKIVSPVVDISDIKETEAEVE